MACLLKNGLVLLGLNWCLSATALAASDIALPEKLHLVLHENSAPFSFREEGEVQGISVDIYRALAEQLGVELKVSMAPYPRAIQMVYQGQADTTPVFRLQSFPRAGLPQQGLFFSDPSWRLPLVYYANPDNPLDFDLEREPGSYKIGVLRFGLSSDLPAIEGADNTYYYGSIATLLRALRAGRIDLAGLTPVGALYWQQQTLLGFKPVFQFASLDVLSAYSQKSLKAGAEPTCRRISQAYREMAEDGRLEAILAKYQMEEIQTYSELPQAEAGPKCEMRSG